MKRLKKIILLGVAAVVLVVVVGVVLVGVFINSLAKKGIEAGGTYALGVPTTVSSANVGLVSGRFSMSGLNVGNPQGFAAPHFMTLGDGAVAVSLGSLTKDPVNLPELTLDTLDVRLERKAGQSNYGVILDNLGKLSSGKQPAPKKEEGKRFVIEHLTIRKVVVQVDMIDVPGAPSTLTKVTIPIDEIKLSNVGKTGTGVKGTGVTMSELASLIVQAVLSAAAEKGNGLIPADVLGDLKGTLSNLGGVKGLGLQVVGDAKGTVEKLQGEVGKTIEDVGKGIKGLIPGGKK